VTNSAVPVLTRMGPRRLLILFHLTHHPVRPPDLRPCGTRLADDLQTHLVLRVSTTVSIQLGKLFRFLVSGPQWINS
jgi:hypothetical protein